MFFSCLGLIVSAVSIHYKNLYKFQKMIQYIDTRPIKIKLTEINT